MSDEQITFTSKGLKLVGNIQVPAGVARGEKRPAFIVLHGFGSTRHAGNVKQPCALMEKLGYVTMRFDMPGCGDSEGPRGRLICLDQVQATSDALDDAGAASECRRRAHRGARLELRRRGRGLLRRRRQARGRRGLGLRLGPWRAQIPEAASDAGRLREVHRHAGGGQGAPRAHRRAADGAALRHRADPGAPAHARAAGLDPDVRGRHRAEHVRLPAPTT